jgi:hypothetical protein
VINIEDVALGRAFVLQLQSTEDLFFATARNDLAYSVRDGSSIAGYSFLVN